MMCCSLDGRYLINTCCVLFKQDLYFNRIFQNQPDVNYILCYAKFELEFMLNQFTSNTN